MLSVLFALPFLLRVGWGRRVQTSASTLANGDAAHLRTKMADPKFGKVKALVKRADQAVEAMINDPSYPEFKRAVDLTIKAKVDEVSAEPEFQDWQNEWKLVEKETDALVNDPSFLAFHAEMASASEQLQTPGVDPKAIEYQIMQISENPQFQKCQEMKHVLDQKWQDLRAMPSYLEFQDRVSQAMIEAVKEVRALPKFKRIEKKAKIVDETKDNMVDDPHFEEYQELDKLLTQLTQARSKDPASGSLAQISEFSERSSTRDPSNSIKALTNPMTDFISSIHGLYMRSL